MMPLTLSRKARLGIGGAVLLALGGAAGAVVGHAMEPSVEMAPIRPVAIRSLPQASGIVSVRGRVGDVFGNKFVIDDGTGHALIDTGRKGDEQALVQTGSAVTAQGRFDRGVVHASFLIDAAGTVRALGPAGGPPDRHGPPPPPPGAHLAPPPPPPGAPGAAPPPPPMGADGAAPPPTAGAAPLPQPPAATQAQAGGTPSN